MSINGLFSSARRSLLAHQAAAEATGNNVANVETVGYTRRRVDLRSVAAARGGIVFHGMAGAGNGVGVAGFERVRSAVLDEAVRNGRAAAGGSGEGAALLAGLEAQLAPDRGDAFLGAVGGFFDAWGDVASAPTDGGSRDALMASADHLASTLRSADGRLRAYGAAVQRDLSATVESANAMLAEVAALNTSIAGARAGGTQDLDALDRRDLLLDELSALAPFDVQLQDDGAATVTLSGMAVVQDGETLPLRLALPPDTPEPQLFATGGTRPLRLAAEGGALGAQLSTLTDAIPSALAGLDALAADLVDRVNTAHTAGTGLDGTTGQPFFDPAGTTAATLRLDAGLTADGIAAGAGAPGDATVAAAIGALGEDVGGAATRLLAGIGSQVRTATAAAEANAAVADYAGALRDGVSKVSLDEEMTNLIQYQQAYAASARVLQTAESLFDTLLAM